MCMLEMEATHEVSIARRLGVEGLRWWSKISYGGGASCATVMHAAAAIAGGLASTVVCHRARNRGAKAARPWAQEKVLVRDDKALHTPWGLIRPVDVIGMWAHRHMHEYGTRREHFGNVAIAARKHAQRNPHALMRGRPLDMATYLAARPIGYPLHLYDCCLESDGALACVVTSVERARDLRQKPALVHSVAQASGPNPVHLANYNNTPAMPTTSAFCAELLWPAPRSGRRTWRAHRSMMRSRRSSSWGSRTTASASAARGGRSRTAAASSWAARSRSSLRGAGSRRRTCTAST